jgi:hypothetical protein
VLLDEIGESRGCHRTVVDLSETGLISWFNQLSCVAIHALACMSCQQSEQLMATPAAELGAEMI